MTDQDEVAASARGSQALRLAQTIRGSEWFKMQKRSLRRHEYPSLAQVVALVEKVAATAPPVVKDWPDCCTHDNPHHGPVPVGGVHWSDGTDLPAAPALDVAALARLLKSRYGDAAFGLAVGNLSLERFQMDAEAIATDLARLTGQQEDDR